jgi:hypothetical protein
MAQEGDTITYTFSDGTSVSEDVSSVDEVVVDYLYSAGGGTSGDPPTQPAGSGGAVTNVVVDVSNLSTIYIWVSGGQYQEVGRYTGGSNTNNGGGSAEISAVNTNYQNSVSEPFIVAGGGGGGAVNLADSPFGADDYGGGGARGGKNPEGQIGDADGDVPPVGGDAASTTTPAEDGDGAVSGHGSSVPIVDSGTTTKGGGSAPDNNGEIKLSFQSSLSPPDPPSNLSANVQ